MLKKTLKKVLAVALTVAAVATTLAVPVSAAKWVPKKAHKDSEVQERALYLIDKADEIAFSPYSNLPGGFSTLRSNGNHVYNAQKNHAYFAYAMCEMLFATPNLKSACSPETVSELNKARSTWKKAYMSDLMYYYYSKAWYDTYNSVENILGDVKFKNPRLWNAFVKGNVIMPRLDTNKVTKKATDTYNRVKKYIAKYKKYNPTVAAKLNKWNTTQYKGYKKLAKQMKGFTADKFITATNGVSSIFEVAQSYYKAYNNIGDCGVMPEEDKLHTKVSNWYWKDMGMTPFDIRKDSPFHVFERNVKYGAW